jgi:hypothetical protein
MTGQVWLYISVACDTISDAQTMLRNFTAAGLNADSTRVNVAIGDSPGRTTE